MMGTLGAVGGKEEAFKDRQLNQFLELLDADTVSCKYLDKRSYKRQMVFEDESHVLVRGVLCDAMWS